jgi:taurine dioxygenase
MTEHTLCVDRLTPTIGALIDGIDLSADLSETMLNRIYELLIEHLVIFFPNQALTPDTLLAFAKTFGELDAPHHVYPHVPGYERIVLLENDGNRLPNTDVWHTDLTFKQNPPFASILYAKAIPKSGGDTLWCSMYAAYDALPDGMKADLHDLSAVHATGSYWNQFYAQGGIARLNEGMAAMGAAVHPIVARHPVTRKPFLYVNRHFTTHVLGMSSSDSQRLLATLFDHINQPEFQIRFRWHLGTVAMWDNRVTQHYAVADYLPQYRCMHRVTVVNDRRSSSK